METRRAGAVARRLSYGQSSSLPRSNINGNKPHSQQSNRSPFRPIQANALETEARKRQAPLQKPSQLLTQPDDDDSLAYVFQQQEKRRRLFPDPTQRSMQIRHDDEEPTRLSLGVLSGTTHDDDGADSPILSPMAGHSLPPTSSALDQMMQITRGRELTNTRSEPASSSGARGDNSAISRNHTLRDCKTQTEKNQWKTLYHALRLDCITLGPDEDEADHGMEGSQFEAKLQQRYYMIFGPTAPTLTQRQVRTVSQRSRWELGGVLRKYVLSAVFNKLYHLDNLVGQSLQNKASELLNEWNFIWKINNDKVKRGKFLHPGIVEGVRKVYFSATKKNTTSIGNLAPCSDIIALRDALTAESVAWICIAIRWVLKGHSTGINFGEYRFKPSKYRDPWTNCVAKVNGRQNLLEEIRLQVIDSNTHPIPTKERADEFGDCQSDSDLEDTD